MDFLNGGPETRQIPGIVPVNGNRAPAPMPVAEAVVPYDSYGNPETGGLIEYAKVLLRHKGKLCLFTLGGIVLGILFGTLFTPVYKVRTALEVVSLNQDFMNMKQTSPVATNDESYDTSEEETQVQLLQSDALLDRVMGKFDPGLVYISHSPHLASSGWRSVLHLSEHTEYTGRQLLLKNLADSLKVKSTPRTRVIEVTAKSIDPKLARDFTNTLASEFIEQAIESRLRTTEKIGDWLGHELDDARARLQRSENALQRYAGQSGLIFTNTADDQETNIETEKLQQIQQQLTALIADRVSKESRAELAEHSPPDSLPDVLSDDALRSAQASVSDAARKVAELSAVFTPDFPRVKRATAELAALKTAFEEQRSSVVQRIKNDYTEALRKEKLLAISYDAQARAVLGQDEKAIQYKILKRDVDSNRQLYDTMLQQLKQSSIASALHASNIRVIDPATLPQKPVWPNYFLLAPLGLLFGLMAGLCAVVVSERMDRSLRQPGDIQLWTNLPELGTIPSASLDGNRRVRIKVKTGGEDLLGRQLVATDKRNDAVELVTWHRRVGVLAEAFRATLTSILFVGENGSRPQVVMLTSANARDGKTTVAANLAIAMAEVRGNVLIIDADMRRPRLHNVFDVPNCRGLAGLLKEPALSTEEIAKSIQQTGVPGLSVLTSGASPFSAANLLHSGNLADLLVKLRAQFDMVLIDTPPMFNMADARLIGRHADAVVLVARAQHTTRDAIMAAYQRLAEDRIRVFGTVLNDWDPKRSSSYNGYYRGYGYKAYDNHYKESAN